MIFLFVTQCPPGLSLRSVTALLKLPVVFMFNAEVVICLLYSKRVQVECVLVEAGSFFSNIIILVLLRVTVRVERSCAEHLAAAVGTRSSANSRHLILLCTSLMPGAAHCSNVLASWLIIIN